jgi:hypothetical protein
MPNYISPPPQNPVMRILTAIITVIVLAGAFTLGFAALVIVAGIGLVAGIVIWLRVLWIKRQLRQNGVDLSMNDIPQAQSGNVIDAEYTVVSDSEDQRSE